MKSRKCRFGGCGDPTCRTCGGGRGSRVRSGERLTPELSVEIVDSSIFPSVASGWAASAPFFSTCGNPGCPICNKGRDDTNVRKESEQMSEPTLKMLSDVMAREFRLSFGARDLGSVANVTFVPDSSMFMSTKAGTDPRKSRPSQEELALREKVKTYLLETKHQIAWADVVGNEAARAALLEAIEHPVVHKELYEHYGRRASKGVLLYGPPGCGKTMFGKAAAAAIARIYGDDDVPLLKINGPEIQTPFVGQTEAIIRDIFAYARAFAKRTGRPLVVFIDEADSLLPSRDGAGGRRATSWEESQVASFLAEMDGLETSGAFVILATNRPHAIDAAVLRDGRCDRKIRVVRPDEPAARAILAAGLSKAPLAAGADPYSLAEATAASVFDCVAWQLCRVWHSGGMDFLTLGSIVSGAMLVGLVERAKAIAFSRDLAAGARTGVGLADLEAAVAAVFEENCRLNHVAAIEDLAEAQGFEVRTVSAMDRAA